MAADTVSLAGASGAPAWPRGRPESGLSIVVPLFGFCQLQDDLQSCAVFRLERGRWRWLTPTAVSALIRLG